MLAHVQRLVSAVKMATMLEEYTNEEQCSVAGILRAERLNAHGQMFPTYGGKWVEEFPRRSKVINDARTGVEVAETTFKRLLCCGFQQ
jgi:hypothetical protein